ncbi:MAG TPA: response regulator [Polyangiaceae bacterium]|nr:response regulator [Polyangiaceae bacterium]
MATDPYRYFRVEARELVEGLAQGVLELEKGSTDAGVGPRLFRLAHTLKGAARVVRRTGLAELAHAVEELLARGRDQSRPSSREEILELLGLVDRMSAELKALDAPPAATAPTAPQAAPVEDAFQTVRIEIEEMDTVLRAVMETGVQLSSLAREITRVRQLALVSAALSNRLGLRAGTGSANARDQALAEELRSGLERSAQGLETSMERVTQELADVREGTDRLRLVPAEALFPSLQRAVRDAAEALEKQAELTITGGGLRLDAHVLTPLRAALLHLVRNAVAHGIESPAERRALGKAPRGTVALRVERRDQRVVFTCSDDGRGVDVRAVRRELAARGLADAAELAKLSDDAVLERLLGAGISTTASVTPIAGRGVGLDVVRETAQRLSGDVRVRSEPGRGTAIELAVPVSLAAVRALVVEAGATTAAIALDDVRETLRLEAGAIGRTPEGDVVSLGGKILPFLPLGRALRQPGGFERATARSAVVVAVGERTAVVGVDRLLGTFEVVVRPLPRGALADPVVAGAALDAEGNPRLVLDTGGLLTAAGMPAATNVEPLAPNRLPILVIDDSLTTRMLEQSILESAGYAVEVAVSAEQGLEKARQKPYGLFIVDVEMPGMNGFEFVGTTRADPELRRVPAILVSSRDAPEDLKKGEDAGASAYVVKGEFDQNLLLSHIRRLFG